MKASVSPTRPPASHPEASRPAAPAATAASASARERTWATTRWPAGDPPAARPAARSSTWSATTTARDRGPAERRRPGRQASSPAAGADPARRSVPRRCRSASTSAAAGPVASVEQPGPAGPERRGHQRGVGPATGVGGHDQFGVSGHGGSPWTGSSDHPGGAVREGGARCDGQPSGGVPEAADERVDGARRTGERMLSIVDPSDGRGDGSTCLRCCTPRGRRRKEQGMERLAGADAGFFFVESATQTSTCVDARGAGRAHRGRGAADARATSARTSRAAWRACPTSVAAWSGCPLGLAPPGLDRRPRLRPGPTTSARSPSPPRAPTPTSTALVARLLEGRLDLRHPLWQLVLVHGLAGGRQALFFRFHHSMADGAGGVTTLDRLFGPGPAGARRPLGARARPDLPAPGPGRACGTSSGPGSPSRACCCETLRRFRVAGERRKVAAVAVPGHGRARPTTLLNRCRSAERRLRPHPPRRSPTSQRVRAGTGASAQRRRARRGGRRPAPATWSSGASSPRQRSWSTSPRPWPATPRARPSAPAGNRFANFFTTLATDVDDPRERLAAIAAGTAEAKAPARPPGPRHHLRAGSTASRPRSPSRRPGPWPADAASGQRRRRLQRARVQRPRAAARLGHGGPARWSARSMVGPVADGAGLTSPSPATARTSHVCAWPPTRTPSSGPTSWPPCSRAPWPSCSPPPLPQEVAVHRLNGEDAGFLYMEQPDQPMNTDGGGHPRRPATRR